MGTRRATLNLVAGTLWYVPGSFGMARLLGPQYSLRCVLFHDISDTESSFTKGLGVTITRQHFEAALKFITRHYTPVSLQDVIADSDGRGLPPRPVLVTFDDAYRIGQRIRCAALLEVWSAGGFLRQCGVSRQPAISAGKSCLLRGQRVRTGHNQRRDSICRWCGRARSTLADRGLLSLSSWNIPCRAGRPFVAPCSNWPGSMNVTWQPKLVFI